MTNEVQHSLTLLFIKLDELKLDLTTFFKGISETSLSILTWTSPVVAALLALTTIVFSQYNDRLLNTSNSLHKNIKMTLSKNRIIDENVNDYLNDMIYTLRGKSLYTINLLFFSIISFLSSFAWLLIGISYLVKDASNSIGDRIIYTSALFIVTFTFFILPVILIAFNKRPILKLDFKNRLSFTHVFKYINNIINYQENKIVMNLIQPLVSIEINSQQNILINFKQEVPISEIYYILEFNGKGSNTQILKLSNSTTESFLTYKLVSTDRNNNNHEGLYNKIRESDSPYLYIFAKNKKDLLASYKIKKIINPEGNVTTVKIQEEFNTSYNEKVITTLRSKKDLLYFSETKILKYKLDKK